MISRRAVLAGGAAVVLTGCSDRSPSGSGPAGPSPATTTPTTAATTTVPPTATTTPTGGPTGSATPPWGRLARSLEGSLARPGDAAYAEVRLTENPRYDAARPLAVLSAASSADVAAGIRFARDHDLPVAVRSGGHCYAGWSAGDHRLVIDVRPLSAVRLAGDRATVGAGASLAQVYDAVGRRGRGVAGGSCPTVGIAGLTLGGGVGVLTRAYGLTCDRLTGLTLVTAAGDVVTVSADHEPDLFWALRGGGGGHVGVVTSLTFDTFPAPDVSTAFLRWPLSAATDVVPAWQEWVGRADPRLWSTLKGLGGQVHPDGPIVEVAATWTGPDAAFAGRLDALLAHLPAPGVRSTQRRGYLATMQAYAGCTGLSVAQCSTTPPVGRLPRTAFAATSSVVYSALHPAAVGTFADRVSAAQGSRLTEAGISVDALGGRVADLAPSATAFPHRRALATVQYTATYAGDRAATASRYVETSRAALTPALGDHAYVNYSDATLTDYRTAYFGANAARLAEVRRTYDPDGFFTQPQDW